LNPAAEGWHGSPSRKAPAAVISAWYLAKASTTASISGVPGRGAADSSTYCRKRYLAMSWYSRLKGGSNCLDDERPRPVFDSRLPDSWPSETGWCGCEPSEGP